MTLTISLPADTERVLQDRARAAGLDVSAYAVKLLEQSLASDRWLEELSGEVGKRFAASGISEDQLTEELERAKHEMRVERRARRGE